MLKQPDSGTIGSVTDFLAKALQVSDEIAKSFRDRDEYIPLAERLAEFVKEPDKAAGFVFVGNDTWLPKHLANARKQQRRKMSRLAESGIVWTR